MLRLAPLLALLAACTMHIPVSQFDTGVADMCAGGVYDWQAQAVEVITASDVDELYGYCGPDARACSQGGTMWVMEGPHCPESVAHELNHIQGDHWVDRPKTIN